MAAVQGTTVADESFHRRVRTLLRSAPVHRLAELVSRQGLEHADRFDLRVLSLAAIDDVMARQYLPSEHTYDSLVELVAELASIAVPEATDDEAHSVGRLVVDGLLNLREQHGGQKFDLTYSDYRFGHVQRHEQFWLLVERARPDGRIVMEFTADAANAFRGGLDMDVEDAQMATEFMLRAQIERKNLPEAEVTAQQRRRLSFEQTAEIKRLLDATRTDIDQVDWAEQVLARLEDAREQVALRSHFDEALLTQLAADDELRDPELRAYATRLVTLLKASLEQHRRLHGQLIAAPEVFYQEQQRQALRHRGRGVGLFATRTDLLDRVLTLPEVSATEVATSFTLTSLGSRSPRLPRLCDLLDSLLAPPRETDTASADDEWDTDDVEEEREAFSRDDIDVASRVLAPCEQQVIRLSELLSNAARLGAEREASRAPDLVRLAVLWAYAPEADDDDLGSVTADIIDPDVVAVPVRQDFEAGGFAGDDLLVGPVHLIAEHLDDADRDDSDERDAPDLEVAAAVAEGRTP